EGLLLPGRSFGVPQDDGRRAASIANLNFEIDNPSMPVTLESIRAARERIKDVIYHSACNYSLSLSRLCNARIHCKLDHLQVTGSFKERGARNKLKLMLERGVAGSGMGGVIAASA